METGKELCEILKGVRRKIADKYDLNYVTTQCKHKGNCSGTCPRCDAELKDLQQQLDAKGISYIEIDDNANLDIKKLIDKVRDEKVLLNSSNDNDSSSIVREEIEPVLSDMYALEGDIQPMPEKKILKKRKLYKKCTLAGIGFHDIEEIWDELYVGAKLELVRENDNKYDKNAVAVALTDVVGENSDKLILGYIPRAENEYIAAMLDLGWNDVYECEIYELNEHRPYHDRVHIAIYVVGKEENVNTEGNIRALSIDAETYNKIGNDLAAKGYTYFRWGNMYDKEGDLPKADENIVFINYRLDNSSLYLMHVIATDDDAFPYIENEEEFDMLDDCTNYVLTNVKGPILLSNDDLGFLNYENIDTNQPESYLTLDSSEKLKKILYNIK